MRITTFLVTSSLLTSCGADRKYENPYDPESSTYGKFPAGATSNTPAVSTPEAGMSLAIKFSQQVEIPDANTFYAASLVGTTWYFSAKDSTGVFVATMDDTGQILTKKYVGAMSNSGLTLTSSTPMYVAGGLNTSDPLYISDNASAYNVNMYAIDRSNLIAQSKVTIQAGDEPYIKLNGRWTRFHGSEMRSLGMVDGQLISTSNLTDPATGLSIFFGVLQEGDKRYYDGNRFYIMDGTSDLYIYNSNFTKIGIYTTKEFPHQVGHQFLADGNGSYWIFGCSDSPAKCYRAKAEFANQ